MLFRSLVLVAPIPKFLNKNFDINEFFGDEIVAQSAFLQSVNERRNTERENKVLAELKKSNILAEKVRVYYLRGDLDYIDVVKVYLKADYDNDKILDIVSQKVGCDKSKIKIYSS